MKRTVLRMVPLAAVLAVVIAGVSGITGGALRPDAVSPPSRLHGGEASIEKLLDRFLAALRAKDRGALEAIRVTEDEYRNVIVPGAVQKGEPPQRIGEEAFEYYWGLLDGKSVYSREGLLTRFGGRSWTVKAVRPQKGIKEYADYRTHRRIVIDLVDEESGEEAELETGSIVEVDGQFKFVSYIRD